MSIYFKIRLFFTLFIKILLFLNDSRVINTRIWNTNYKNCSSGFVNEVNSFRKFTSTNAHQGCTFTLSDFSFVCFKNIIECFSTFLFLKYFSISKSYPMHIPFLLNPAHHFITRKKQQNTSRNVSFYTQNKLS